MRQILSSARFTLLLVALGCLQSSSYAQPPATSAPLRAATEIRESWPRTVYLEKDGELLPLVNFPWADHATTLDLIGDMASGAAPTAQANATPNRKTYTLTELELKASAKPQHAVIRVTVGLRSLIEGRQFIPVELPHCHFTSMPVCDNDGQVTASFNRETQSNELQLVGKADQDYEITFEVQAPLKQIGQLTKLQLSLPRVAKSSFQISIPDANVVPVVEEGQVVETVNDEVDSAENSDTAQFSTLGLASKFVFAWRPPAVKPAESSAFEVQCDIDVLVDTNGTVTSDASLAISSFAKPIKDVIVLLPPGTRSVESFSDFGPYTVNSLGKNEDGREQLEIGFDEELIRPREIRLQVQSESEGETSDAMAHQLAGFEVVGATSLSGEVHLYSQGDWRLKCLPGESVRRITTPPSSRAKASYSYSKPNQIRLSLQRQQPELIVEPRYSITLGESAATIRAVYVCTVRGAYPPFMTVEMGDLPWRDTSWNIDGSIPDSDLQDGQTVELPIPPIADRFEIAFSGSISFNALQLVGAEVVLSGSNSSRLEFFLPFPKNVKTLLASTVAISTAPNIVASPRKDDQYDQVDTPNWLSEMGEEESQPGLNPTCLRMHTAGPPSLVKLIAAKLEGEALVECETEIVSIAGNKMRVEQRMQWTVREVEMNSVSLTIDEQVCNDGNLVVAVNGQPVVYQSVETFFNKENESDRATIRVNGLASLGSFEMTVGYDWAPYEKQTDSYFDLRLTSPLVVPIALPKRDPSSQIKRLVFSNQFRKPRMVGYDVSLFGSDPSSINTRTWLRNQNDQDIEASTESFLPTIPLVLTEVEADVEPAQFDQLVHRAWFQTWYTATQRRDRATFRVSSGSGTVRIQLPASLDYRRIHAWVDREKQDFRFRDGVIELSFDPDTKDEEHIVELISTLYPRESTGVLETEVPRIQDADVLYQWYWHVVMPRNECLVTWPRSLIHANRWDWTSLFPRRVPQLSQEDLESWSGAMSADSDVLWGSTQYLFGAMGEPDKLSVRTTSLPVYVIAAAGGIFLLGLLLMYLQRQQRVWVLCLAGALMGGFVFLHPSYASIGGQVAVFGVMLVVMTSVLSWLMRQSLRNSTLFGMPLVGRTPSLPQYGSASGAATTAVLPVGSSKLRTDQVQ